MPRPTLSARLSLPSRLKSSNGSHSKPTSHPGSRSSSPKPGMGDHKANGLVLRTTVVKARNLAAKDKNGSSDPYIVVTLGEAKEATPAISKSLNPEWNQTFDLPITGVHCILLEAVCWDKDRFGKDYMGQFDVMLDEIFAEGRLTESEQWYPLQSKKIGKKNGNVTGEVLVKFVLLDLSNPSATPEELSQKLMRTISAGSMLEEDEDFEGIDRVESMELEDNDEEISDEVEDQGKPEAAEKRKRRLRLAKLKRKATRRGYEFSEKSEVAGVLFLEIVKITDLPPEKNMTRTSFDMDPFVVTSLGKKTYRTRVIRHNLNPIFEEKLVFQVLRHETNYSLNFSVVDRDKLSGNDFVGSTNFPLEKITSCAPEADSETGLYKLPEPQESPGGQQESKKSRFRLPLSRSSSATSLSRLGRPSNKKEDSTALLQGDQLLAPPPTSVPSSTTVVNEPNNGNGGASNGNGSTSTSAIADPQIVDDADLKMYQLSLDMKNKEKWEAKHSPTLYIRAKYLPYKALRQQFWRAMLRQYDADDSGLIDKVELTTMLDTLGSTLHEATIDSFFKRFKAENKDLISEGPTALTFEQAIICLEDQLQRTEKKSLVSSLTSSLAMSLASGSSNQDYDETPGTLTPSGNSGVNTPLNDRSQSSITPVNDQDAKAKAGEESEMLKDDLADDKGEEHVVEIRECPICHQPRLNKKSDADIITHVATCASQDWRQVNNIVMAGFVTSSQAQRKWYSKVISKITYGGYKLGANSANILVQDRITGQISEERMSVYVRLGIRLLYKGLKANNMEKKRIRKLLKSLSIKQGKKYDDPASAAEIPGFIAFHQLDMSEVLLPTDQFKNFNEFFYRALKPGARPCSAPDDPKVITSPADCRTVVFNKLDDAQTIWVKGREFSIERLFGNAYPDDAKRYKNGGLAIFRLAPQDYHRFHIPVDGVLGEPKLIEGEYYTVNPMAIRSTLDVYGENVRVLVPIDSVAHGRVMVVCVGAMMVGSTVITRNAGDKVTRAEELGYFKFGGSTVLVLFEPGVMQFDSDLAENSNGALETLVRVGMSVGHSPERAPHTLDMRKENPTLEEKMDAKRRIEGSAESESDAGTSPSASA